ncbi:tetratricopeptide repeat protein [Nonomuraea deserti]|uniref:tetratricopeptide repeat protein n=1 Tax=Nonomuraea deserti TaxID=1848322 RepID=UPI0014045235|nr:tetratricopeptide repeat protein [Nonomuraea deserti]
MSPPDGPAGTRRLGNRRGEAAQLDRLAVAHSRLGRFDSAIEHFKESVDVERGAGNRFGEAITLSNIGLTYRRAGLLGEAQAAYERALALTRDIGDDSGTAIALGLLAELHRITGRREHAVELFQQALRADGTAGNRGSYTEAIHWWGLGSSLQELRQDERARECWHESARLLHRLGLISAAERAGIENTPHPRTPEVVLKNM